MHFFVYLVFAVLLICMQTTLMPALPDWFAHYDLLIPLVVYLTLFRASTGILPVIILSGVLMDLLSGGGGYIICFLLIFISFRHTTGYFHFKNHVLFLMVVVLAVVMENFIFNVVLSFQLHTVNFSFVSARIFLVQLFWAVMSGPFFYRLYYHVFTEIDQLITGGIREKA